MAINKKLIHFKNKTSFDRELKAGNILDASIAFIQDAKEIWTHGTIYPCPYTKEELEVIFANYVEKVDGKGLSSNDFTDAEKELLAKIEKPLNYRGSVATYADLPTTAAEGDIYNVVKTDVNYAWTGTEWDPFGSSAIEIVDDLTTGGTTVALSAEQGKVLKEQTDNVETNLSAEILRASNAESALSTKVDTKVDKIAGKGLSTNDYTTVEKNKLASLANYDDTAIKADIVANSTAINTEVTRAKAAEKVNADAISSVDSSYKAADTGLQTNITNEVNRAKAAETILTTSIQAETERALAAEEGIRGSITSGTADGGDIPVMPLYRQANIMYTKVPEASKDTTTLAAYIVTYNKAYVGKKFNRVKMMLATPGRCRISIFNKRIFEANPTIENTLVKDLVNVVCTSSGYKYWDLEEDIVVEEDQFIGAWYTADCARYTYNNDLTYQTAYPSGWLGRTNLDTGTVTDYETRVSLGYLNVGLYMRGGGSDFEWGKLDESNPSSSSTANAYYPKGQEKLVGKPIYKIRLKVTTIGSLTVNVIDNYGKNNASIVKSWKLYIRQLGVQTLRLPEDIILKEGQGIGVYALGDTCQFAYGNAPIGDKYALKGWWQYTSFNYSTLVSGNDSMQLGIALIERGEKLSVLEDKTISIQGDSISTFAGTVTDGNAAYYSSTHKFVNSIDATWWGLLTNECRMRLLRNDAWSGSRISGSTNSAMCSAARCANLKYSGSADGPYPYGSPEIIVIMAGTNDVSGNVALGNVGNNDVTTYIGALTTMLQGIRNNNRNAKVVLFQLYRGNVWSYTNSGGVTQYQYQAAMEQACRMYGVHYVGPEQFELAHPNLIYYTCNNTLSDYGAPSYESTDYLHPNMQGMERVYAGIRSYLESLY